jgi:hypothetical protein
MPLPVQCRGVRADRIALASATTIAVFMLVGLDDHILKEAGEGWYNRGAVVEAASGKVGADLDPLDDGRRVSQFPGAIKVVKLLQPTPTFGPGCTLQPSDTDKLLCQQRIDVPDEIAVLLRTDDFGAVLRLAKERGIYSVFAHMRKLSKTVHGMLHPTLDHFDWVLQDQEQVAYEAGRPQGFFWTKGPGLPFRTVLATQGKQSLTNLYDAIKELPRRPGRTLVFCGSDDVLSGTAQHWYVGRGKRKHIKTGKKSDTGALVKRIRDLDFFESIRYEAYDMPMDGVEITPQPMSHRYTGYAGENAIFKALEGYTLEKKSAESPILAAWGAVWKDLDTLVKSRREAKVWTETSPLANRSALNPQEYWTALVSKRFMLCPTGGAIQSPKVAEAMVAMTIPITYQETAYHKLSALGWPIVHVNSWEDITADKLKRWWLNLSPKLLTARWMYIIGIWGAYVSHPCPPGNYEDFLNQIKQQPLLSEMNISCPT